MLSYLTSLLLSALPDRQPELFLRANLSGRQVLLHLPVLEQFQQHTPSDPGRRVSKMASYTANVPECLRLFGPV